MTSLLLLKIATGNDAKLCRPLDNVFFTSRSTQSTRTAGPKIALCFPRLIVCPHLSHAQYITSYVTMRLQYYSSLILEVCRPIKLQQMKVVLCCLDGKNLVGSRKDPVFVAYSVICFFFVATNWKCKTNYQVSTFAVLYSIAYQFLQNAYCSTVTTISSSTAAGSLA